MSKGNMLFSQARGKVGDLVFSRLDGEQIVRSRNRHPKNPKTNAQLYQRAIMATVLRAYSAGKVIFDHAFEGKQVGAQNQRAFLSLNAKRLRAAIAADLANNRTGANAVGHVVAPGIANPVPFAYQVSSGSLTPSCVSPTKGLPAANNGEKIGEYAERVGLVNGHIHTFVAFCNYKSDSPDKILFEVDGTTTMGGKMTKGGICFVRFVVDIADADLDTVISSETTIGKFLKVDETFNCDASGVLSQGLDDMMFVGTIDTTPFDIGSKYAIGVIHSIENEGLRSDCILQAYNDGEPWGIESLYLLQAWSQGSAVLGDSDLILEGGDL